VAWCEKDENGAARVGWDALRFPALFESHPLRYLQRERGFCDTRLGQLAGAYRILRAVAPVPASQRNTTLKRTSW